MIDLETVAALALGMPQTVEETKYGNRAWTVMGKMFVWERPFSKADLKRFGDETPPTGPIIGLAVDDLIEKEVVLDQGHPGFFTISHFDGHAAVLIQLDVAEHDTVAEAVVDAWLCQAPAKLAEAYLDA